MCTLVKGGEIANLNTIGKRNNFDLGDIFPTYLTVGA